MALKRIYCFPGLGVDHRLFSALKIPGAELLPVYWPAVEKGLDMRSYAKKFAGQIDTRQPYWFMGVSFGGMIATELTEILQPEKTILISSACKRSDLPLYFRLLNYFPVHLLLGDGIYKWMARHSKWLFGIKKTEAQIFYNMLESAPPHFYRRAVNYIIKWNRSDSPGKIICVHGDKDLMLPIKNIEAHEIISGGDHEMVFYKARELSVLIGKLIS